MTRSDLGRRAMRGLALAWGAALAAGCGGGTSVPGPQAAGTTRGVSVRIFFPRASGRTSVASVPHRATPKYVSTATQGITIVTKDPSENIVDSEAYSTNTDNPNCKPATTKTATGNACTFVVGVAPGIDTFEITTYDGEPTHPTGDPANVYHALHAKPLSTSTMRETIAAGTNNAIGIALGGIVAGFTLSTTAPAIDDLSNGAVVRFGGQGTTQTIPFSFAETDADGNAIAAGYADPLQNPIVVSVAENNGSGHTTLVLTTTDANGNVVVGQPSASVTLTQSGDTVTATYDGAAISTASAPYTATVTASSPSYTEPTSDAVVNAATSTVTFAPIFVEGIVDNVPGDYYGDVNGKPPTFTVVQQASGSTAVPKVQIDNAGTLSTQPTNGAYPQENGTAVDLDFGGVPCTAFSLRPEPYVAGSPAIDDIVVDGVHSGAICRFAVGDGTSPGQTVEIDYP